MRVFGICVVRNEEDIIRVNVLHHLSLGLDCLLVVDNGSSDGTVRELQRLGRDKPVMWRRDDSLQFEIVTGLAREAFRRGADWVVPIDADEFWWAHNGDFRGFLARSKAGAIRVQLANFIQRRDQRQASPRALLHMTRRIEQPVGPPERCRGLVESHQIAFVGMMYPPKWISRPSATIVIAEGNHAVSGIDGPYEATDEIVCLHAPLRSRSGLEARSDVGRRRDEAGLPEGLGWHKRRWYRLQKEGGLDKEWSANSYVGDWIDVYGTPQRVIFDPTLRDVVSRWIRQPLWSRLRWTGGKGR